MPAIARERLLASADRLVEGRWRVFEREIDGFDGDWDWFLDPLTGRRAPADRFAASIDHRNETAVGNVKILWELSRHHHVTVLAAAYFLSGEARYAIRIREHLRSWWRTNPFLTGIHWTNGIEVGMRLVAWTWVRRLLDGWPEAAELFEENPAFRHQLQNHQRFLARIRSHGSSGNNHLIAELTGLFVSTCAFSCSEEGDRWRERASEELREEIDRQTFPEGINRELATEYHGFVLELLLAAALEGEATGHSLGTEAWRTIRRMVDALAGMVDGRNRPPRLGDGDGAHGLLLDPPEYDRWSDLLACGTGLFGALPWWPGLPSESLRAVVLNALAAPPPLPPDRPVERPTLFPEAGFAILRAGTGASEIWCLCDHGPLGFLSTAAHGHADALSIELRVGGVEVFADPGTYCYHGEPEWRAYFRSTLGHNTLELDGRDQSDSGGAFLWTRHARARLLEASGLSGGSVARWRAAHDGYGRLDPPAAHERTVELDREARSIAIQDRVTGEGHHEGRLVFHLGPQVKARLEGLRASLRWKDGDRHGQASVALPPSFDWAAVRGRTDPPLGWYSRALGSREPTTSLVGRGLVGAGSTHTTHLEL